MIFSSTFNGCSIGDYCTMFYYRIDGMNIFSTIVDIGIRYNSYRVNIQLRFK